MLGDVLSFLRTQYRPGPGQFLQIDPKILIDRMDLRARTGIGRADLLQSRGGFVQQSDALDPGGFPAVDCGQFFFGRRAYVEYAYLVAPGSSHTGWPERGDFDGPRELHGHSGQRSAGAP